MFCRIEENDIARTHYTGESYDYDELGYEILKRLQSERAFPFIPTICTELET